MAGSPPKWPVVPSTWPAVLPIWPAVSPIWPAVSPIWPAVSLFGRQYHYIAGSHQEEPFTFVVQEELTLI